MTSRILDLYEELVLKSRDEEVLIEEPVDLEEEVKKEWFLSVDIYRQTMKSYKRISEEENRSLATIVQSSNDICARNRLVLGNWSLAVWFSNKFKFLYRELDFDDVVQWAMIGMLKAADLYRPDSEGKFSTYSVNWMKSKTQRACDNMSRNIRVAVHQRILQTGLLYLQRELEHQTGRFPSLEEVAGKAQMPTKKIYRAFWHLNQPDISLEDLESYDSYEGRCYRRGFERDRDLNPEQVLIARTEVLDTCHQIKKRILWKLPFRQKRDHGIFRMRYRLDGSGRKKTLDDVGTYYGITRERVRQVEAKAWHIMKKRMVVEDEAWLLQQLEKIDRIEDLLGENIADEIFRVDHPTELRKVKIVAVEVPRTKKIREVMTRVGTNEVLSKFLREKRFAISKSQLDVAKELGVFLAQYGNWERAGCLPKDQLRRQKLADILKVTVDELLEKASSGDGYEKPKEKQNLIPLIQAISQSNCQIVTLDDFVFLVRTQSGLGTAMSPSLVDELMKHRS